MASILRWFLVLSILLALTLFVLWRWFLPRWLVPEAQTWLVITTPVEASDGVAFFHRAAGNGHSSISLVSSDDPITSDFDDIEVTSDEQFTIGELLLISKDYSQEERRAFLSWLLGVPIAKVISLDQGQTGFELTSPERGELGRFLLWSGLDWEKLLNNPQETLDLLRLYFWWKASDQPGGYREGSSLGEFVSLASRNQLLENRVVRNCPISVINTTPARGVARHFGTVLENAGALVVRIDSRAPVLATTTVLFLGNDEGEIKDECQPLIPIMDAMTPNDLNLQPARTDAQRLVFTQHRADLVILLGADRD